MTIGGIILATIQILPHGLVVGESVGVGVVVSEGVVVLVGVVVGLGVVVSVGVVVCVGVVVRVGVVVGVGVVVLVGVVVGVGGVVVLVLKCFFYLLLPALPWFFCPHRNQRAHKRIWWVSAMKLF